MCGQSHGICAVGTTFFEIGSDVTVVRNLTIGPRAGRSADRPGSYYLTYLPYEPIEPYEPMCVGSHSSHWLCWFHCLLVLLPYVYIDPLPASIEGASNCSLYSLIHTLTKSRRSLSDYQARVEPPSERP